MARTMQKRRPAFTLLELLVVITLMSIAVGMAVFRLDGVTDSSRLRSGATQITSLLRLTQTQARTSGMPRLVEYEIDSDRIIVHSPHEEDGRWSWDAGVEYLAASGGHVKHVLIEGDRKESCEEDGCPIRIGPDGGYRAHAVILELHGRYAVVILRALEEPRYEFPGIAPHATSFELLMVELEQIRDAP